MRIIFFGTPDFAVASLDILVQNGVDIAAVVTASDKPGGRGGKSMIESAVKKYAVAHNLPLLQPEKLRNPEFLQAVKELNADLFIVVAFRMMPEILWSMPPLGTFNLHGSLLPKYRGAAPINWAVINGEKETGVTTFFLKHEIDTGDLLFQERLSIGPDETAGELHDRMMSLGADLVLKTVKVIESGKIETHHQNDDEASHAPKLFEETCKINFEKRSEVLHNFVRGLSPYPTAWTMLEGLKCKVYKAYPEVAQHNESPGTYSTDHRNWLRSATADGYIYFTDLQVEGRKRMDIKTFLNGAKLSF